MTISSAAEYLVWVSTTLGQADRASSGQQLGLELSDGLAGRDELDLIAARQALALTRVDQVPRPPVVDRLVAYPRSAATAATA